MSYNETAVKELLRVIPQTGKVEWIGIRSKKKSEMTVLEKVSVEKGKGLKGDHFQGSNSGKRQVTLIQKEHLDLVAGIFGCMGIDP